LLPSSQNGLFAQRISPLREGLSTLSFLSATLKPSFYKVRLATQSSTIVEVFGLTSLKFGSQSKCSKWLMSRIKALLQLKTKRMSTNFVRDSPVASSDLIKLTLLL